MPWLVNLCLVLGMLPWSSLPANTARYTAGTNVCRAHVTEIDGEEFTIQCGADRAGNNENDGVQTSFDGCAEICAEDCECVTAQYSSGFCYSKSSQNQLSEDQGVDTFDKGDGCTSNLMVAGCTVQCNTDSPGNNLDSNGQYVGNYAACAALCAGNSRCATAQYKTTNGFCYQKSRINGNGFSPAQYVISLVCPNNGCKDPKNGCDGGSTTSKSASTTSTRSNTSSRSSSRSSSSIKSMSTVRTSSSSTKASSTSTKSAPTSQSTSSATSSKSNSSTMSSSSTTGKSTSTVTESRTSTSTSKTSITTTKISSTTDGSKDTTTKSTTTTTASTTTAKFTSSTTKASSASSTTKSSATTSSTSSQSSTVRITTAATTTTKTSSTATSTTSSAGPICSTYADEDHTSGSCTMYYQCGKYTYTSGDPNVFISTQSSPQACTDACVAQGNCIAIDYDPNSTTNNCISFQNNSPASADGTDVVGTCPQGGTSSCPPDC